MGKLIMFCAVLASAVSAWAHFPINVEKTSADDGLLKVGWSPVQFCVFPDSSWQLVSGAADAYGVAVGLPWGTVPVCATARRKPSASMMPELNGGLRFFKVGLRRSRC